MAQWQPITMAPREHRILLAKIVGNPAHETSVWWVSTGEWSAKYERWLDRTEPAGLVGPTHWMEIPLISEES